jgi:glycerol-3-phosphate dehydrogenase
MGASFSPSPISRASLVGTTDVLVGEEERAHPISREEVDYLCAAVNTYFQQQIARLGRLHLFGRAPAV